MEEAQAGVPVDGSIPPSRAGRLLRSARRRRGLRLGVAARLAAIDRATLAAYERGWERIPDRHLAVLGDLYGGTVTGPVPLRVPVRIADGRIAAGGRARILASQAGDAVLGGYVELITGLRNAKPGEALALRTSDLEALAFAIGTDTADVEARIVEIMGCSREEAAALHHEMLRRRVLAPVAGIALGAAALAGAVPAPDHAPARAPLDDARPLTATSEAELDGLPAPDPAPTTTVAPASATPPATPPATAPTPTAPATPTAPPEAAAEAPAATATPVPTDDPIVTIPPGETFIEIGDPAAVDPSPAGDP